MYKNSRKNPAVAGQVGANFWKKKKAAELSRLLTTWNNIYLGFDFDVRRFNISRLIAFTRLR